MTRFFDLNLSDAYKPVPGERSFTCSECGVEQHWLSEFPKRRCIDCHERATAGNDMTIDQITQAFGGQS